MPPPKIMDDPKVEAAMHRLVDALEAAARQGGGEVERFSIVTVSSYGDDRATDVTTSGCQCTRCRIDTITAMAQASGARVELGSAVPGGDAPALH